MEQTAHTHKPLAQRWGYLAMGTVAMLFMGVIYAWSILKVPLAQEFGWTPGQLAFNYAVCFCTFCLGSIGGSFVAGKKGSRLTILLGGIIIGLSYLAASRISAPHAMLLYLLFGLPLGIGTGMGYNTILSWISAWFPDKRGTCSGILMMGFGFGALLLGHPLSWMFSSPAFGWRRTYSLLGLVVAAILACCALLFRGNAPLKEPPPQNAPACEGPGQQDYTPAQMLRRPSFWRFYLYGVLTTGVGGAVFSFAYDLCLALGAAAALATTLVGLLSAFNGLSRIVIGMLYDRLGLRRTMLLGSSLVMASAGMLLAAVMIGSLPLGILGLCLTGLGYGYSPVISATIVNAFYGTKHFAANYSLNNTKTAICSFSSTLATALLTSTGTYAAPFAMLLGFAAVAFGLHFTIRQA